MQYIMRALVLTVAIIPSVLIVVFLLTGSLSQLGIDSNSIFYNGEDLAKERVIFAIGIAIICLAAGIIFTKISERFCTS